MVSIILGGYLSNGILAGELTKSPLDNFPKNNFLPHIMRKTLCLILLCILGVYTSLLCDPIMYQELSRGRLISRDNEDNQIPFSMQLDKWFPHHSKIRMGDGYYLTTPYFNGLRGDFFVKYDSKNPYTYIVPNTEVTFTDRTITFKNGEVMQAYDLTERDFREIAGQLAWLQTLFRSLGSPIPDMILSDQDDVEHWVIIYEDGHKNLILYNTFSEAMKKISQFYQGYVPYFQYKWVRKTNNRLEFFATLLLRDMENEVTDYVDVRFHTNLENEIDLAMFFIYRKTDIKPENSDQSEWDGAK